MTLLWMVPVYFLLACVLAALVFLPAVRQWVWGGVLAVARRVGAFGRAGRGRAVAGTSAVAGGGARAWGWFHARRVEAGVMVLLLLLPPVLVFSLRGCHSQEGFNDVADSAESDRVVSSLLEGEQLVPPPSLPPEVFATMDVETVRPKISSADRRWDLMDEDFRQRLLLAYRLMRDEHGYNMVLLEGYRSPERQAMLASLGPHVTNAGAWQSYHQYGLAADSAFLRDGKIVITERDPWAMKGYELFGEVSQRVGLIWGGRWKNADLGHVELRKSVQRPPAVNG